MSHTQTSNYNWRSENKLQVPTILDSQIEQKQHKNLEG